MHCSHGKPKLRSGRIKRTTLSRLLDPFDGIIKPADPAIRFGFFCGRCSALHDGLQETARDMHLFPGLFELR